MAIAEATNKDYLSSLPSDVAEAMKKFEMYLLTWMVDSDLSNPLGNMRNK